MSLDLTILYRGPLSSCNYDCGYCPFAKRHEKAAELRIDQQALRRFVDWLCTRAQDRLSIFFTPWGEALTRRWYQDALVSLSRLPQIEKLAVQTNLSSRLEWIERCDPSKLALWCTFHPSQTTRREFLAQCRDLSRRGVRYSAGAVGLKDDLPQIEALRRELPPEIYLWINAYKQEPDYYSPEDIQRLEVVDPLFRLNTRYHSSLGRACRCGHTVISVDGEGTISRCHFIKQPLGNLYQDDLAAVLRATPCSNHTCGCHIGYVHMNTLGLDRVFGDGILERIPRTEFRNPETARAFVSTVLNE